MFNMRERSRERERERQGERQRENKIVCSMMRERER